MKIDDEFIEHEMLVIEHQRRHSSIRDTITLVKMCAMLALLVLFTLLGRNG